MPFWNLWLWCWTKDRYCCSSPKKASEPVHSLSLLHQTFPGKWGLARKTPAEPTKEGGYLEQAPKEQDLLKETVDACGIAKQEEAQAIKDLAKSLITGAAAYAVEAEYAEMDTEESSDCQFVDNWLFICL